MSEGEGAVGPGYDIPQGGNFRERSLVWVYTTEDESASVHRSLDLKTTQSCAIFLQVFVVYRRLETKRKGTR